MRSWSKLRGFLLSVLLLISVSALCAAPEGVLHAAAGTTVDGVTAIEGMHVFSGQFLRTPAGHFSELLTHGTSLRLLGGTELQFNTNSAELFNGGLLLNTSSVFEARCGCATVTPHSTAPARYLVQLMDRTVYVTAQQNEVTVSSRKAVHVSNGKTVAVYCAQAAQPIVFVGTNLSAKVMMGAAAAAAPLGALPKQDMSSSSPSH